LIWLDGDNLLLIQNIMELELTQEIDRLNSEVDTLRSQVTFWEEKSDHRKERIKELKDTIDRDSGKLKKENEKLKYWASEVIYYSHSASLDNLEAKKLITPDNKPTIADVRDFGQEIKELKEEAVENKKLFDTTFGELMKLKEENEEIKKDYEELSDNYEYLINTNFQTESDEEEIEELKSQIPDKKNKKLSQKDKEVLEEILHNIEHHGTDEYHNDGGGWFYEAKVNLLKRLLK